MENRFGKKKISFAVLALLMALFTALFASSCGNNGNGSDSLPGGNESVSPIDKSATVADAHLPAYKTYATYPDLNVESLRARRDELVVGIIGSEAQKGYKNYSPKRLKTETSSTNRLSFTIPIPKTRSSTNSSAR